MAYSALSNEYFHRNGLVRMLWWVPEIYKVTVTAELPTTRTSFNVGLDMGLNISEIAGVRTIEEIKDVQSVRQYKKRPDPLEQASNEAVMQRMRESGIEAPKGRALQSKKMSISPDKPEPIVSPFASTSKSAYELQAAIDATALRIEEVAEFAGDKTNRVVSAELVEILERIHHSHLMAAVKAYPSHARLQEEAVAVLLDIELRLVNIEASFKNLEDGIEDRAALDALRTKILALQSKQDNVVGTAAQRTQVALDNLLEDQLVQFSSPPLMAWDRRYYEPLRAESTDFWPKFDLSLFDMVPNTRDLSVPGLADSQECSRFCAELLQQLFMARNQPLPSALDKIGVNAGKDLIPMVPAITDVRKGGRLNPDRVKTRMLTEEMVEGLVKAFFEWPFRPQSWELALAGDHGTGEGEHDSESENEEVTVPAH